MPVMSALRRAQVRSLRRRLRPVSSSPASLLRAVADGDLDAFDRLYDVLAGPMFSWRCAVPGTRATPKYSFTARCSRYGAAPHTAAAIPATR